MRITLTSKRQATFPKQLCDELGLRPGDQVDLERHVVRGSPVWILRPYGVDWSFLGAARPAKKVSHDMDAVRASIARGRTRRR